MKILLIGSFRYEFYAPAFSRGFRQLGCEVIDLPYDDYHFKGNGKLVHLLNMIQDRYHYGVKMRKYNKDIIKTVNEAEPDMVFLYRCYHIYNFTLKAIKDKSIIMSYNNDDPFSAVPSKSYYRYHIANAHLCHINFVYRKKNIDDYAKLGVTNTKVLLPYYLSWQNKPVDCEKDIPIAFVGHFENDGRDKLIIKAIKAGVPIQVFGGELWKESKYYNELIPNLQKPVIGDEYNLLLNRIMILIVFFSKHNHDTYTRRCFEIPAAKGLMFSEYTEDMNRLYPENESAVYFRNADEFVEKAKRLLDHPKECIRIGENAYLRLKELGGSEVDRCQEIINKCIEIKNITK